LGAALVLLYPFSPNLIFRFMSLDGLAMVAASGATSAVFPGDRIAYSALRDVTFFNIVFVLVNSLQTDLLGAIVGLLRPKIQFGSIRRSL